ncbi:hypothetical protein ACFFJT_19740 [Dyella flava]|uniref:DUF4136 domain-containing protein n=1 Tax=Dyella flava TaxID=1920170 RepID=A0ABS2JZX1_9GAMM|nr:hypothetical protein [Dyella flava]MBM7124033.1 hypothetical protein [Dyella flava]GLQ52356.1 hypothetical protein GCM10010872_38050 [Dyella flava]
MKASLKARPGKGVTAIFYAIFLMPLALLVAGCSGTLRTQWAAADDTYFRWKPMMNTMPVEVHGDTRQLSSDELAKQIPYGTTQQQYALLNKGQSQLAAAPRVVLYVDPEQNPGGAAYCDTSSAVRSYSTKDGDTHLVAALCDGPRLVDVTARNVRIQNEGMASVAASMKQRLLYGLKPDSTVFPI